MFISTDNFMILNAPTYIDGAKYLKTRFRSNKSRFLKRAIEPISQWLQMNGIENYNDWVQLYTNLFDKVNPYSYAEALNIKNDEFRAEVFSIIDVPQMIKNLGSTRIKVEGIELINKVYNTVTKSFDEMPLTQIYELHLVNGKKLGIEDCYAIKCWCTSTKEEHWLWVNDEQAASGSPLEAIASTCNIYECMENNIKHIIRQGDVFLFEMIDPSFRVKNFNAVKPLDKETYFKLLKSQS